MRDELAPLDVEVRGPGRLWRLIFKFHRAIALLLMMIWAVSTAGRPPADREGPLREAVWGGRWLEGLRL
jgi:hypothetical protein